MHSRHYARDSVGRVEMLWECGSYISEAHSEGASCAETASNERSSSISSKRLRADQSSPHLSRLSHIQSGRCTTHYLVASLRFANESFVRVPFLCLTFVRTENVLCGFRLAIPVLIHSLIKFPLKVLREERQFLHA